MTSGVRQANFDTEETGFLSFCLAVHLSIIKIEPHREKTGFLPMRKQRRRSIVYVQVHFSIMKLSDIFAKANFN